MARRARDARTRAAFWREVIDGWRPSGLTQAAYCRQRGVTVWSFHEWRRKLREQASAPPPAFVTVDLAQAAAPIEVVLSNGRVLRVPAGADCDRVARLAVALEPAPC